MYENKFLFMAHNDYLRIAYETGIVGLSAYLTFLFLILAHSIKKMAWERNGQFQAECVTVASIMIAFLIMSAVDNLARSTVVLLYTFCVIGALLGRESDITEKLRYENTPGK